MKFLKIHWFPVCLGMVFLLAIARQIGPASGTSRQEPVPASAYDSRTNDWTPPDINLLPYDEEGERIRYGRELFTNTSYYLGPAGKLAAITNGMNCQNCHLEGGTVYYGGCLSAVASSYPTFRARSGIVESIGFRVNDCLKRSLNGQPIDTNGNEMKALVAYMEWLGREVPKGVKPNGANTEELPYLDRAADTVRGKRVFLAKCQRCHGSDGQGAWNADHSGFKYPPLWGPNSFNTGAGLYRLSRFAGFVKNNMPQDSASYSHNILSVEEAWDVAAFVNSQPRPDKSFPGDWPDLAKKAIDHPFGPYADGFSETQHKYGPFGPIKQAVDKKKKQGK